ncbi:MAG: DUF1360 domain-containing protein [Actinobacteria bacterium]|nr:DUF1360 domain-containing protein [Actinomycetota bacterium]
MADRMRGGLRWAKRQAAEYGGDDDRPLGGYLAAIGTYLAVTGSTAVASRLAGRRPSESVKPWDVVLLGVATHKMSRILAKDAVTSPLRAPFTHYEESAGDAELMESPRQDSSVRHAIGELVTCPFCLDQWVASGFAAGTVLAPRSTRLAMLVFAATAVSDALQLGYAGLQKLAS